ncbi:hypothetical protein MXB_1788 [Myxobolus squamalis]|nr:hypothetical protein MXB_1788 [Myxobolus squamalis]
MQGITIAIYGKRLIEDLIQKMMLILETKAAQHFQS